MIANAFLPEAISIAVCPVAQYLGLKLDLQFDHSVVPQSQILSPKRRSRQPNQISPLAKTHWLLKR
jgi:hypothetical protein